MKAFFYKYILVNLSLTDEIRAAGAKKKLRIPRLSHLRA